MRPAREVTAEEENYRTEEFAPGMYTSRRDPIQPEPIGTIVLTAFRVTGYDRDCDGSLMARVEQVESTGDTIGWEERSLGLYPSAWLVVTPEELRAMFATLPTEPAK